jgi:hypothetical protein
VAAAAGALRTGRASTGRAGGTLSGLGGGAAAATEALVPVTGPGGAAGAGGVVGALGGASATGAGGDAVIGAAPVDSAGADGAG